MFCKSCGKELADSTEVCPFCQTPTKKGERTIAAIPSQVLSVSHTEKSNSKKGVLITVVISLVLLTLIVILVAIKGFGLFDNAKTGENTDGTHTTECSEPTETKDTTPPQNDNDITVQPI